MKKFEHKKGAKPDADSGVAKLKQAVVAWENACPLLDMATVEAALLAGECISDKLWAMLEPKIPMADSAAAARPGKLFRTRGGYGAFIRIDCENGWGELLKVHQVYAWNTVAGAGAYLKHSSWHFEGKPFTQCDSKQPLLCMESGLRQMSDDFLKAYQRAGKDSFTWAQSGGVPYHTRNTIMGSVGDDTIFCGLGDDPALAAAESAGRYAVVMARVAKYAQNCRLDKKIASWSVLYFKLDRQRRALSRIAGIEPPSVDAAPKAIGRLVSYRMGAVE